MLQPADRDRHQREDDDADDDRRQVGLDPRHVAQPVAGEAQRHHPGERADQVEEGEFGIENILEADEVFLSGATRGINWVEELNVNGNKIIYSNTTTQKLFDKILTK